MHVTVTVLAGERLNTYTQKTVYILQQVFCETCNEMDKASITIRTTLAH